MLLWVGCFLLFVGEGWGFVFGMKKRLVLASGSPRRRELLGELGFEFEVMSSPAEEVHDEAMGLVELCELNAFLKAKAVADLLGDGVVVLGGDTLVCLDGVALGKPKSEEEAVGMLRRLSGREHEVCTGMCLVEGERKERFSVVTRVFFRELSDAVIADYMSKVNVMDKAGSYAVQECGEMIVERVEGDFTNVVGLPQEEVGRRLCGFGLQPEV